MSSGYKITCIKIDDPKIKSVEQKEKIILKCLNNGYHIMGNNQITFDDLCLQGFEQRLTKGSILLGSNNNEITNKNYLESHQYKNLVFKDCQILYLPIENHLLSFFVKHNLESLFHTLT